MHESNFSIIDSAMNNIFTQTRITRKVLALIIAGVFCFNTALTGSGEILTQKHEPTDTLSPRLRVTLDDFRERFLDGYNILSHRAVNAYITIRRAHLNIETAYKPHGSAVRRAERQNILIVPVRGLLKNTGQLTHIGLGRAQGIPILYIDSNYSYDDALIKHMRFKMAAWETKRRELNKTHEEMRIWAQTDEEAKLFAEKTDQEAHKRFPITRLLDNIRKRHDKLLDFKKIHDLFLAHGFQGEDHDINIAEMFLKVKPVQDGPSGLTNIGGLPDDQVDKLIRALIRINSHATEYEGLVTEIQFRDKWKEFTIEYDEDNKMNTAKNREPVRELPESMQEVLSEAAKSAGIPYFQTKIGIVPSKDAALFPGADLENSSIIHAGGRVWFPRDLFESLIENPLDDDGNLLADILAHEKEHQENPDIDIHARDPEAYMRLARRVEKRRQSMNTEPIPGLLDDTPEAEPPASHSAPTEDTSERYPGITEDDIPNLCTAGNIMPPYFFFANNAFGKAFIKVSNSPEFQESHTITDELFDEFVETIREDVDTNPESVLKTLYQTIIGTPEGRETVRQEVIVFFDRRIIVLNEESMLESAEQAFMMIAFAAFNTAYRQSSPEEQQLMMLINIGLNSSLPQIARILQAVTSAFRLPQYMFLHPIFFPDKLATGAVYQHLDFAFSLLEQEGDEGSRIPAVASFLDSTQNVDMLVSEKEKAKMLSLLGDRPNRPFLSAGFEYLFDNFYPKIRTSFNTMCKQFFDIYGAHLDEQDDREIFQRHLVDDRVSNHIISGWHKAVMYFDRGPLEQRHDLIVDGMKRGIDATDKQKLIKSLDVRDWIVEDDPDEKRLTIIRQRAFVMLWLDKVMEPLIAKKKAFEQYLLGKQLSEDALIMKSEEIKSSAIAAGYTMQRAAQEHTRIIDRIMTTPGKVDDELYRQILLSFRKIETFMKEYYVQHNILHDIITQYIKRHGITRGINGKEIPPYSPAALYLFLDAKGVYMQDTQKRDKLITDAASHLNLPEETITSMLDNLIRIGMVHEYQEELYIPAWLAGEAAENILKTNPLLLEVKQDARSIRKLTQGIHDMMLEYREKGLGNIRDFDKGSFLEAIHLLDLVKDKHPNLVTKITRGSREVYYSRGAPGPL